MKIVVIDGQGGKIGTALVAQLKGRMPELAITAIGTNSLATQNMLKAGAAFGATGENPVIVACADADIITGALGITLANSLMGEITPDMACAVGKSRALKVLIPLNRCGALVAGVQKLPVSELIKQAVDSIEAAIKGEAPLE